MMTHEHEIGDMVRVSDVAAFVVYLHGNAAQVAIDMPGSEFRTVHRDALTPLAPSSIDADTMATIVVYAQRAIIEGSHRDKVFAHAALSLRAAYLAERQRADGTEDALTGEGEALTDVAKELELARAEMFACKQALERSGQRQDVPMWAQIDRLAWQLESQTTTREAIYKEHDAIRAELKLVQGELDALKTAHEQAIRERDEALELARREQIETMALLYKAFSDAKIRGYELGRSVTLKESVDQAADAIREFGILNRELLDVSKAIDGIVPPNKNGERVSTTIGRIVAELVALRKDAAPESQVVVKASHVLDDGQVAWVASLPELTLEQREIGSCYPTAAEEAHVLAAMDCNVHAPNDEHMANVMASDDEPAPYSHERPGTGSDLYAMTIMDESVNDAMVEMGADPAQVYGVAEFRAAAHEQLADTEPPPAKAPSEPPVNIVSTAHKVLDLLVDKPAQTSAQIRVAMKLGSSDWTKVKDYLTDRKMVNVEGKAKGTRYSAAVSMS